ncbi:MAG: type II toxin-antitoxin system RelE/ParE family toxin [Promethearchaeota archaeon]|nr:MAG: type II toxin-antitoxin system RelE/ParE family toxin [Candidatus Lokiarchaeota archaeon]
MVDIEFHPIAKEDIKELYDYFSRFSLQYADSFIEGLYDRMKI